MFRVSTSQLAQNGLDGFTKNQAVINNLLGQISSGNRSDLDTVERTEKESYTVRISNTAQYMRNGETVLPNMINQDSALNSISEKLIQLQETMIAAQDPATYDRNTTALYVNNIKEDILNLVNSKDSEGNYLFSGYKSQTPSFTNLNNYQGDQGVREIRIGENSLVQVNLTGNNIITNNVLSAFKKIDQFINSGINDVTMIDSVQNSIQDISLQQTILAGNINKISSFKNINTNLNLQNQTRLSQINDVDLPSLISQLVSAKTNSEASLKSYATIQDLSLFNYI